MIKQLPALLAFTVMAASASAADVHVSPNGADTNPGTADKPFGTLAKARDAAQSGDQIMLKGGTYRLNETLVLGPRNSGVTWMAAPGETPVLSGGVVVTGWTEVKNGLWKAPVKLDNFRQLWVNSQRAQRARGKVPEGMRFWGKYGRPDLVPHGRYWDSMRPERRGKFDAEVKLDPMPTGPAAEVILDPKYCPGTLVNFGKAGFTAPDTALAGWRNPSDMEFGFYNSWTHAIAKVEKITKNADGGVIIEMSQPGFFLCCNKGGVQDQSRVPSYLENAFELLDEPGEWYFDRPEKMLYYKPRPGEDMAQAEVVAPRLEQLLLVKGTLDNPVRNVTFNGLAFAHATWLQPSTGMGHPDTQANFIQAHYNGYYRPEFDYAWVSLNGEQVKSPANVVVDTAHGVTFEHCGFTALGGAGLDVQGGSQSNIISRCRFDDISGNGIQIGDITREDHHPSDPRRIVKGNRVLDCLISRTGQDYTDSVGVFYGYTVGTVIAHNEIRDIPYTGITGGWGWGMVDAGGGGYGSAIKFKTPAACKDNRIEYNHIHQVNQVRDDGGGIYMLGRQPGTVIRGNHIHDSRHGRGVYLDEGAADIEVYDNLIYRVHGPLHCNNRSQNRIATCKIHDNLTTPPASVQLVPGMKGSALKGGSSVDEPVQPFPAVFTVAAHVRLNKYPEGADARRWIVCRGGNERVAGNLSLFVDGRNLAAYLHAGGALHTAAGSDTSLPLNRWTPVAASYDGDTLRVFCNGKEVAAKTIGKPYQPANAPLTLGARGDRFTVFDCGDIDEARLFDRVLTPAEMGSFPTTGAVKHWPFDSVPPVQSPADEISRNAGPRQEHTLPIEAGKTPLPDCVNLKGEPAQPHPFNKDGLVTRVETPVLCLMRTASSKPKGTVLIFPSGAYHVLSAINDGSSKAQFWNGLGYDAAILDYTISEKSWDRDDAIRNRALQDALAAVRLIRAHATELGLNREAFILMGGSAGGHLATRTVAALHEAERPDAMVLFYPAYLEEVPPGAKTAGMPLPAGKLPSLFVTIAANDAANWIAGARRYVEAWNKAPGGSGKATFHLFDDGGHGFKPGTRAATQWPALLTTFEQKSR